MIKKLIGLIILIEFICSLSLATTFAAENLLLNGDFEAGTASWFFYSLSGGTFTTPSPGYNGTYQAQCVVYYASGNVQFYQYNVSLERYTRYRLTFSAYSQYGHDLQVDLVQHVSPYANYSDYYYFNLDTTWQTFSVEFTSLNSTFVTDCRFRFWMAPYATNGEIYYYDDVKLEKGMGDFFLLFP